MSKAKTESWAGKGASKVKKKNAKEGTRHTQKDKVANAFLLAERLLTIDAATVALAPNKPVKVALLEGERLRAGTAPHRKTLLALPGFREADLILLPLLLETLEGAERRWSRLRFKGGGNTLSTARKNAEKWRRDAMAAARYLARHNVKDLTELDRIAAGEGLADLVQDLDDLVNFVQARADKFGQLPIRIDVREAQKLAAVLREGRDAIPGADALAERNRAFWALENVTNEIRAALRFVLRDEPKKLMPLLSRYEADRQAKHRRATKTATKGSDNGAAAPEIVA
ncbi:MAG: hypothetical protein FWD73_01130 [Polyangiaceae bacterium]|nr:hypothetical protein [Polyangiaceae bacterium]